MVVFVWLVYGGCVAVASGATYAVLAYYSRQRDCAPLVVSWLATTAALALFLVLPVDTYIVSNTLSDITCSGLPMDGILDQVYQRTRVVQYVSYGLWGGSAAVTFIALPLLYFYYEESVSFGFEASNLGSETAAAVKYIVLALLLVGGAAAVGAWVQPGFTLAELSVNGAISEPLRDIWQRPLEGRLARAFNFMIAATGAVGLLGWITYTATGLVSLPIHLLKGRGQVNHLRSAIAERERLLGDRYYQIREKARRYGVESLSRQERRDAETSELSRVQLNTDRQQLEGAQSGCNVVLDSCPVLRYIFGLVLLLVSMLLLEAAGASALDMTLNNSGFSYGFVLKGSTLGQFNLLNFLLSLGCNAGADCDSQQSQAGTFATFAAVTAVAMYLILSTFYGMVVIGTFGWFRIKVHRTWPQSLLAASFLTVFTLWGASLVFPALAPQFFYYGCQSSCLCEGRDPPDATVLCTDDAVTAIDLEPYFCIRTQISLVSSFLRMSLAPLGIYMFGVSWGVVLMMLLSGGIAVCRTRASNKDDVDTEW